MTDTKTAPTGGEATLDEDFLTAAEILAQEDILTEVVEVPEWLSKNGKPGKVRVKALTGTERDNFEASLLRNKGQKNQQMDLRNIRAKLCSLCMVDAEGKALFTAAQVTSLGAKSAAALDRVYAVAQRLSKFTKEDIEELAGNSEGDPGDIS